MKNEVLVVSTNREKYPCPVLPAGAIQLTKQLTDKGIKAYFLDLCFETDYEGALYQKLESLKPRIVIFSIRNIDNETYIHCKFYLPEVRQFIQECKKKNIMTVIGGIGVAINPKGLFDYLNPDFTVSDCNLNSTVMLALKLIRSKNAGKMPSGIFHTDSPFPADRKKRKAWKLPVFDWEYIIANAHEEYFKTADRGPASVGIRTKQGCGFRCVHCQIPRLEGRRVKPYLTDHVILALQCLEKSGIASCFITDNVFNEPYDQAYEIASCIVKAGIHIKWSCYLSPGRVDKKLIRIMKKAGCTNVQFGIDTASEKLLKLWKKGFTASDIVEAGRICEEEGISCFYSLMLGGPGETKESIAESLATLKRARAKFIWGALGVRVQPGTELYFMLLKSKIISEKQDLAEPYYYLSPGIRDSYQEVIHTFKKENPEIILKINTG